MPAGLFPGGAPFNVAYHLHQLGIDVKLISAVGRDRLGDELLRRLRQWGIDDAAIVRHHGLPTGNVIATVGAAGDAAYEITESVAWDQILVNEDAVRPAMSAAAVVFGSLAQRSPLNRAALERLLTVLPADALRVFDVNLRAPFDDIELVRRLANSANVLKLNAVEAARLVTGAGEEEPGSEEPMARALAEHHDCATVCITCGGRGAGLLRQGTWYWEKGHKVDVVDTVGAGDAFLARLLAHLLAGDLSDAESLASATRHGEWVATQRGATPAY